MVGWCSMGTFNDPWQASTISIHLYGLSWSWGICHVLQDVAGHTMWFEPQQLGMSKPAYPRKYNAKSCRSPAGILITDSETAQWQGRNVFLNKPKEWVSTWTVAYSDTMWYNDTLRTLFFFWIWLSWCLPPFVETTFLGAEVVQLRCALALATRGHHWDISRRTQFMSNDLQRLDFEDARTKITFTY